MKIIYTVPFAAAAIALAGCSQMLPQSVPSVAPQPTVTVTAPAPTPEQDTETYSPPPESGDALEMSVLEEVWQSESAANRRDMCLAFNYDAEQAWQAFNEGAEGKLAKATFMKFFSQKCGY